MKCMRRWEGEKVGRWEGEKVGRWMGREWEGEMGIKGGWNTRIGTT